MKRLIILRHAKSSWDNEDVRDHDRTLNRRGEKSAVLIGEFLEAKQGKPDLIISSTALRAQETAKLVAEKMNYDKDKIVLNSELYLAWINDILRVVSTTSNNIETCMIVGHNPGLTNLINHFGVRMDNLPTASVVCFEFNTISWDKISADNAELKWYQLARDLG